MFLVFLCLFAFSSAEFQYPNENSTFFVDNSYTLKWNSSSDEYNRLILLHKDVNSLVDYSISSLPNGEYVLDEEIVNNTYKWDIPRVLNYFNLGVHDFKLVLTDSNGILGGSLSGDDSNNNIYSDYFSIQTNMNVSTLPTLLIPNTKFNITWDGFKFQKNIYLEEYSKGKWKQVSNLDMYNTNNHFLWTIPELKSTNKFRINVYEIETGLKRSSNEFKIYGIDSNIKSIYLVNATDTYLDFDITQYNFDYNYSNFLIGNSLIKNIGNKIDLNSDMFGSEFFIKVGTPFYNYSSQPFIINLKTTTTGSTNTGTSTTTLTTGTATLSTTTGTTTTGSTTTTLTTGTNTLSTTTATETATTTTATTLTNEIYNRTFIFDDKISKRGTSSDKYYYSYIIVIGCLLLLCLLIGICYCYYFNNIDNKVGNEIFMNQKDLNSNIRVPNPLYDGTSSTSSIEYTNDNYYHEIRNSGYNTPRIAHNTIYGRY